MTFRLLPNTDTYFDELDRVAAELRTLSRTLCSRLDSEWIDGSVASEILPLSDHVRSLVRKLLLRLEGSFITPIEREDIHLIAVHLQDVATTINSVAHRIDLYEIQRPTPSLRSMIRSIDVMVDTLEDAVGSLRVGDLATTSRSSERMNELSSEFNDTLRASGRQLILSAVVSSDWLEWKDIYDSMMHTAVSARRSVRAVQHSVLRRS